MAGITLYSVDGSPTQWRINYADALARLTVPHTCIASDSDSWRPNYYAQCIYMYIDGADALAAAVSRLDGVRMYTVTDGHDCGIYMPLSAPMGYIYNYHRIVARTRDAIGLPSTTALTSQINAPIWHSPRTVATYRAGVQYINDMLGMRIHHTAHNVRVAQAINARYIIGGWVGDAIGGTDTGGQLQCTI